MELLKLFLNPLQLIAKHFTLGIGGGIGEAALIGAAIGGGSALLRDEDPIPAILLGGATGAAGGALFGGGAGGSLMSGSSSGAAAGAGGTGIQLANQGAASLASAAPAATSAASSAVPGSTAFWQGANTAASTAPLANQVSAAAIPNTSATAIKNEFVGLAPKGPGIFDYSGGPGIGIDALQTAQNNIPLIKGPAGGGFMDSIVDKFKNLSTAEKIGLGIAGSALLSGGRRTPENPFDEDPTFNYDWRRFRTSQPFADGGIVALAQGGGLQNRYVSGMGPLDQGVPDIGDMGGASSGYLNPSVQMMAHGGITSLGSYSDGGRLLKGPGDGMSDHIPAMIGRKQPARLADGEFVVPADVVSHLGNGSTDAGAKQLYSMMDRVRKARTGRKSQGKQINPRKVMVA